MIGKYTEWYSLDGYEFGRRRRARNMIRVSYFCDLRDSIFHRLNWTPIFTYYNIVLRCCKFVPLIRVNVHLTDSHGRLSNLAISKDTYCNKLRTLFRRCDCRNIGYCFDFTIWVLTETFCFKSYVQFTQRRLKFWVQRLMFCVKT